MASIIINKIFLTFVIFLSSFAVYSKAPASVSEKYKFVLVIERHYLYAFEQSSLAIMPNNIFRFIQNSNALLPAYPIRMGKFTAENFSQIMPEIELLVKSFKKNKKLLKDKGENENKIVKSVHRWRIWINEEEVQDDDPSFNLALKLLKNAYYQLNWKKVVGVEFEDEKSFGEYKCKIITSAPGICQSEWGTFYF